MGSYRSVTIAEAQAIIAGYEAGKSMSALSMEFDRSPSMILRLLRREKVTIRPQYEIRARTKAKAKEAADLLASGLSYRQGAHKMGVAFGSFCRYAQIWRALNHGWTP